MNSTVKTILTWVLILVAAIGLYQFVERGYTGGETILTVTQFLNKVEAGEVRDATINGSNVTGHLKGATALFRSTIPQDYSTVYDKLTAAKVDLKIIPPDSNTWLNSLMVTSGLVLWLAISVVILVVLVDLSRFLKRQLAHHGGSPSSP
jgi:cell division protease FtsH